MGKLRYLLLGGTAAVATIAAINVASAGIVISGTGLEVSSALAGSATAANFAAGLLSNHGEVTFSEPSPINDDSRPAPIDYTLGGWLATGGATGVTFSNGAASGDSLDNTIWEFNGFTKVFTGETFTVKHDDGVSLTIGGLSVINLPGPHSPETNTVTYTGPTGIFAAQLVYAECCGPPGVLDINLPLSTRESGVPEASTWAMMLAGFAGLGFAAFRRSRRREIGVIPI